MDLLCSVGVVRGEEQVCKHATERFPQNYLFTSVPLLNVDQ